VAELRKVLEQTGAHELIEQRIVERAGEAARRLDSASLQPVAAQALLELAQAAAHRTS
jgi:uncharacterized protein YifE (UPF0438 family)